MPLHRAYEKLSGNLSKEALGDQFVVQLAIIEKKWHSEIGVYMGLLGKIFGSKAAKKPSNVLLKEATQLKKSGDWDGAIKALQQAYKNARSEGVSYGADTYLRLPKYLYEAGKSDEAWSEYNRALTRGLDEQVPSKEMAAVDQSQIYASMAGQLKKEKKFFDAAIYQAASAFSWEKGMLAQKRESELDFDLLEKNLIKILKRNQSNDVSEQFIAVVKDAISNPHSNQVNNLIRQLGRLKKG